MNRFYKIFPIIYTHGPYEVGDFNGGNVMAFKLYKFGLILFLASLNNSSAFADSVVYFDIATCRGSSGGIAMVFDIFQELDAKTNAPTGRAFFSYIMGTPPNDNKNLGVASITLSPTGDRLVELNTILDSNDKFASLTVPKVSGADTQPFKWHFSQTDLECEAR